MLESSLAIRRQLNDRVHTAATLSTLALARLEAGDATGAGQDCREAIEIFKKLGDRFGEVVGLCNLGQIALFEANYDEARSHLTQGLDLARQLETLEIEGECELLLGEVDLETDGLDAARGHFSRSLDVCRDGADRRGEANALWRLGAADLAAGDLSSARARLGDALQRFFSAEMWKELVGSLENFVALAQASGANETAVRIAAVATVTRKRMGLIRRPAAEAAWQLRLEALREPLGDEGFVSAWNEAWDRWEVEDGVRTAMSLTAATADGKGAS